MVTQPDSVELLSYRIRMEKVDSRKALWASLSSLMRLHWGGENLTKLGTDAAKSSPATAQRLKGQENSTGIKQLDVLADYFRVEPWQLLVPGFDAAKPPALALDSKLEAMLSAELIQRLREQPPAELRKIENILRVQVGLPVLANDESFSKTTGAETPAQKYTRGLADPIDESEADRRSTLDRRASRRRSA